MKYIFLFIFLHTGIIAKPCVFCRPEIIENQSVFQTEYFHVLPDKEPRVKGHLLVIPKRHISKAHELSGKEWEELSSIVPKAVQFFTDFLGTNQYIILEKNGPNAFQQIPHVHFHLFPMTGQTWSEIFDSAPEPLSREELKAEVALYRTYFSF